MTTSDTLIDHNYFHDKAVASGETILLGELGVTGDYQDTFSTVENNIFVNCDGDLEGSLREVLQQHHSFTTR